MRKQDRNMEKWNVGVLSLLPQNTSRHCEDDGGGRGNLNILVISKSEITSPLEADRNDFFTSYKRGHNNKCRFHFHTLR